MGRDRNNGKNDDDETLWAYVKRTITPLKKEAGSDHKKDDVDFAALLDGDGAEDKAISANKRAQSPELSKPQTSAAPPSVPPPSVPVPAAPGKDIDRRTAQKLKRGKIPVEAKLDLHGMTQRQAHEALNGFIARAYGAGKRCVLVVTGKGRKSFDLGRFREDSDLYSEERPKAPGILRQRVPEWLHMPPNGHLVLRVLPAQPKDGGDGALYVYLRRQR